MKQSKLKWGLSPRGDTGNFLSREESQNGGIMLKNKRAGRVIRRDMPYLFFTNTLGG